jgi:hypothetical protein
MATADAVNNIIQALNETDEQPRKQIAEIVEVLGDDIALGLLQEVKSVQDTGGQAVRDGTRQRTPGGIFFSLAKSKLPKADRNRIFRLRPPKPVVEAVPEPVAAAPAVAASPKPAARDDGRRRVVEFSASPRGNAVGGGGGGRRRVVDVEVLRQNPRPTPAPPAPLAAVREAVPAQAPEPPRTEEQRPLRRIVTIGPREEPPPTSPEAAVTRVKTLLKALSTEEQRRVLSELLADLGGAKPAPPARAPDNGTPEVVPALRERVLAAVTETLGLSTSDLARVLYGEESAGTRNKARAALERWRRKD